MRVAFLHPDLGLGGAERLIVDAAAELVRAGHAVDVYTAHYDPSRCFEETKTAGFSVVVAGAWFPRHVAGRLMALCAYIRCMLAAIYLAWTSRRLKDQYHVIIVDQVAAVIPLLMVLTQAKLLFYCHFPDLLLTTRASWLKKAYRYFRAPLDWLEQTATGRAHLVLVNSEFTRGVFERTFRALHAAGVRPAVLYPAVAIPPAHTLEEVPSSWRQSLGPDLAAWADQGPLLLSINRFERKKGLGLAILALKELENDTQVVAGDGHVAGARLLLAGGWDARLVENVEHLEELKDLVSALGLQERVRFLPSFTDAQRGALLAVAAAVVYTPQHEHFGIVPLEAMAAGRPVIAVNNGGPVESVVHGRTGLLCAPTPGAFAAAFRSLLADPQRAKEMGQAARLHVRDKFSRDVFGRTLDGYVTRLAAAAQAPAG